MLDYGSEWTKISKVESGERDASEESIFSGFLALQAACGQSR